MSRAGLPSRPLATAARAAAFAAASLLASLALLGCGSDPPSSSTTGGDTCEPGAAGPTLAWKRTGAVLSDLGRALALAPEEVCSELGATSCAQVHRVALGESDPFDKALYRPFAEPLGTTPLALERVVMHACVARVELDRAAAKPVVFTHLDLSAASVADAGPDSAFAKDAAELTRRLLGRDATAAELTVLADLAAPSAGDPVSASDAAILTCFTLGTSREFLFF